MANHRFPLLDFIRGVAVCLMILFHLAFDLTYFKMYSFNMDHSLFWWAFPRVIVFLFLLSAGMSMFLVYGEKKKFQKRVWFAWGKRLLLLGAWSLTINLVTYFLFPTSWIFFGILHCITVATMLLPWMAPYPRFAGGVALFIVLLWSLFPHALPSLSWVNLTVSVDFIPLYPWIAVVCLGIFLSGLKMRPHAWPLFSFPGRTQLLWLGRHSLLVYIIHQPLIFGILFLINRINFNY